MLYKEVQDNKQNLLPLSMLMVLLVLLFIIRMQLKLRFKVRFMPHCAICLFSLSAEYKII